MDIHQISQILIDAAAAIGPVGAAQATMEGGLKAFGGSIFNGVKDWFKGKLGGDSTVVGALEDLQKEPGSAQKQAAVRAEIEGQQALLGPLPDTAELIRLCVALHALTTDKPMQINQRSDSGINIGEIKAEKIGVARDVGTMNF